MSFYDLHRECSPSCVSKDGCHRRPLSQRVVWHEFALDIQNVINVLLNLSSVEASVIERYMKEPVILQYFSRLMKNEEIEFRRIYHKHNAENPTGRIPVPFSDP